MTPRQHSANDGLKPGPQTVPQDFTEGADERHLGSSTNLPLIMSTVPTPHGTTRASLFLSAASPSPAAQAFPQEPRGPSRRASSRRTLEQAPLPHQHPQSPDSTCHSATLSIHFVCEHIKVVKTMGIEHDRPGFDSQPATHYLCDLEQMLESFSAPQITQMWEKDKKKTCLLRAGKSI